MQATGKTWRSYQGDTDLTINLSTDGTPLVVNLPLPTTDTDGGDDTTPSNPLAGNYAPLQQLAFDLANDKVFDYNWITPDQYTTGTAA